LTTKISISLYEKVEILLLLVIFIKFICKLFIMSKIIASLFSKIQTDPWRKESGFSDDLANANDDIRDAGNNAEKVIEVLLNWLQKYQPCLFGRLAAKLNLLSFCILNEEDLKGDDENIQNKIQAARSKWTSEGYTGQKSGFILFVSSVTLAYSIPDENLMLLAKKLCSFYLLEQIDQDIIYTDEIWLEKPGPSNTTWKWLAGVNYFCTNADKRWWQDHRIPGGLAFSVNSVGHMAKAGGIAKIMNELNRMTNVDDEKFTELKIDSLDQGLEFAMRTIALASESISGKATQLISLEQPDAKPVCPINLPKPIKDKDHRNYIGYYHTDITVPSEYFIPNIEKPENSEPHTLDFTYLYDNDLNNPDFIKMGEGRKIRSYSKKQTNEYSSNPKLSLAHPLEEKIVTNSRLYNAINGKS
jgi:hypothetical protein